MILTPLMNKLIQFGQSLVVSDPMQDAIDTEMERYYGGQVARLARATDESPSLIAGLIQEISDGEPDFFSMIRHVKKRVSQLSDEEKRQVAEAHVRLTPFCQQSSTPSSP